MINLFGMNKLINHLRKSVSDTVKYDFKAINDCDFELLLTYSAKGNVLDKIFSQVSKSLSKTDKFSALKSANPLVIDRFEVPKELNNKVHVAVKGNIKSVADKIKRNGKIVLIRSKVEKTVYEKKEDTLFINVKVVGQYVKDRC